MLFKHNQRVHQTGLNPQFHAMLRSYTGALPPRSDRVAPEVVRPHPSLWFGMSYTPSRVYHDTNDTLRRGFARRCRRVRSGNMS